MIDSYPKTINNVLFVQILQDLYTNRRGTGGFGYRGSGRCHIRRKAGTVYENGKHYDFHFVPRVSLIFLWQVINKESLSTQICTACIQKLRVSYEFHKMCQQSSKILQGYLAELLSVSEKISPEQFVNSELRITLQPIIKCQQQRKKRVSKEQRCSLLKKLLLKTSAAKNSDVSNVPVVKHKKVAEKHRGGLRDLINFTKNFDFGFEVENCRNYDHSPLEKLSDFSRNFFCVDFTEFRSTILCVIENEVLTDSEEEEMLASLETSDSECKQIKIEEVIVEPDMKVKKEFDFESEDYENGDMFEYSANFVEACYDEDENETRIKSEASHENNCIPEATFVGQNKLLAEIIPIVSHNTINNNKLDNVALGSKYKTLCSVLNSPLSDSHPPATELLGQFVARFANQSRKSISPHSIRCRTRGNPYINPHLQKQFQLRSFKCNTCNRRFKSPGYLNAHIVKLKH